MIYEIGVYEPEAEKAKAMRDLSKEQVAPSVRAARDRTRRRVEPAEDDGKLVYTERRGCHGGV